MKKPTEPQIQAEMARPGGGNDYFAARERLLAQFREAEAAETALKPKGDDSPWKVEPDPDVVEVRMRSHGESREDAEAYVRRELEAGAKRLAKFSPGASMEISEALAAAQAARERAESMVEAHEALLSGLSTQIFALGEVRHKILIISALYLPPDYARGLAHEALRWFLDRKLTGSNVQNDSGWAVTIQDLAFKSVLQPHLPSFIEPLEAQAKIIIVAVRETAAEARIDLRQVMQLLYAESGQPGRLKLRPDSNLYSGLVG